MKNLIVPALTACVCVGTVGTAKTRVWWCTDLAYSEEYGRDPY